MAEQMAENAFAGLRELLKDAESCIRLSDWEESFLSGLRDKVLLYGKETRVTPAMWTALERIEAKVYAI